ncbi:MAG: hypothetical protein GF418_00170 [Chitinivibrionales bacterium]|nr:hypothetical protein [Chitinivibrionales bacterium]MBD3394014.1 hypothetical protein [Chitinivibrionales bacterium]
MSRVLICAAVCAVVLGAAGCGQRTAVKKGELFGVIGEIRTEATTEWEQPYSDGFVAIIPTGTVLEARFTTTPGAAYFECTPIMVNNTKDPVAIIEHFVPEGIRTRQGFEGFSFTLPVKLIDTKLKRLPKR